MPPISTHPSPRIGIVTVTYNSGDVLPDFLDSVASQVHVDARLYVIDNASTDTTLDQIRSERRIEHLALIANDDNEGISVGNNQGIQAALNDGCEWILLLNNDTVFTDHTVADLVRAADRDALDLVSPVIEATQPPETIWYSGGYLDKKRAFSVHRVDAGESVDRFPSQLQATGFAPACALLVRPTVFAAAGLMDPIYFVYFDDVDFAVRAARLGFRFWVTPAARVIHKASSLTGGAESPFSIRYVSRNWPLFVRRNFKGLTRMYALALIQADSIRGVLVGRDSPSVFLARQRGFREAMLADLTIPPPRLSPDTPHAGSGP